MYRSELAIQRSKLLGRKQLASTAATIPVAV